MKKPTEVNILGKPYSIEYKDTPSEVDLYKRKSLWGQIDFWSRTIRIYHNDNPIEDVVQSLFHEILHAISSEKNVVLNKDEYHDDLDLIALALSDVLVRNGWLAK